MINEIKVRLPECQRSVKFPPGAIFLGAAPKNVNLKTTDLLFARGALELDVVHGEVCVEDDALVLLPGAAVAERRRRRRRSASVQRP